MEGLPSEVLRYILREATFVEGGFSYPDKVDTREQERPALLRMTEAMRIKCDISLVSKRFHALGDEFLLEIVHIGHQKHIGALRTVLRQPRKAGLTRGWWCRHLIVNLRQHDIDWSHGKVSLWGLIPSCPRLEDLRCFLFHTVPPGEIRLHRRTLELYRIPGALCQTIATTLGPSLRYLHFGDHAEISLDLATRLLPHLKRLEVCRFDRLFAPHLASIEDDPRWQLDKRYIEDEYPVDETIAKEYKPVTDQAQWPTNPDETVIVPALKIFKARSFAADFGKWQAPNLQEVIVGFDRDCTEETCLTTMRKALVPHATKISRLTFEGGGGGCLWVILGMLPRLEHIRFPLQSMIFNEVLTHPHMKLTSLVIILEPLDEEDLPEALSNIQENVAGGLLPSLRTIDLEGTKDVGRGVVVEAQNAFSGLGVSVAVTYA
ncbi:hypothetical protein CALCODRAFT_22959 [Calocera cornea HHB12733]|uniref:F-box domain-containing protein n=1 Tax=Calocera cornea HHB12733 TaxID=1353952 RepID=A0A165E5J0_9BASI|nr:hypothetical protein CALCODRAFT_22959 [Calocera cornea HHB12733]